MSELQEKSTDVRALQDAANDMACLASETLGEILGVTRCALLALESPGCHIAKSDAIAMVLQVVARKADDGLDWIGSAAEKVGCGYADPASIRRTAARGAV